MTFTQLLKKQLFLSSNSVCSSFNQTPDLSRYKFDFVKLSMVTVPYILNCETGINYNLIKNRVIWVPVTLRSRCLRRCRIFWIQVFVYPLLLCTCNCTTRVWESTTKAHLYKTACLILVFHPVKVWMPRMIVLVQCTQPQPWKWCSWRTTSLCT